MKTKSAETGNVFLSNAVRYICITRAHKKAIVKILRLLKLLCLFNGSKAFCRHCLLVVSVIMGKISPVLELSRPDHEHKNEFRNEDSQNFMGLMMMRAMTWKM